MHRDLKPENMLLVNSKSLTNIKIIDFGLAKYIRPGKLSRTFAGTLWYVAPEVIEGKYD